MHQFVHEIVTAKNVYLTVHQFVHEIVTAKNVYLTMCINLFMKLLQKKNCLSDYVHQFVHEIDTEKKMFI